MSRPKTRRTTLYRLPGVTPTLDGMFDDFTDAIKDLGDLRAEPRPAEVAGLPALWIGVQGDMSQAEWCGDAAVTTGLAMSYTECRSGGVLLLAVDGMTYAISYGNGYKHIPDDLKDHRFGLRLLIRRLNPDQVQDLVRRRPDARGRTDSTVVPGGAPVWMLGIAENVEIIRRVGGRCPGLEITFSSPNARPVIAQGSAGLQMPYGVSPQELVADIREIERICRYEAPHQALAFIDYVQPVADTTMKALLDDALDDLLGRADVENHVVPVVPSSALDHFPEARSFTFKIGSVTTGPYPWLELDQFLSRTRKLRPGERVKALRKGHVSMNADDAGQERLVRAAAVKWLEASLPQREERYFLMDGEWYEIGEQYVRASREEISRLFPASPSLDLPAWSLPAGREERDYNEYVPTVRAGYLCLDRNQWVRNPLGHRSSLEVCDLLGPGNELIHVKRAKGSQPLSHLFSQGLVSAQSLISGPSDVRQRFTETVANLPNPRALPPDFTPKKVVYAILLGNGKELTLDTLFPFSQVTLAQAARTLHTYGIEVEVIGIPAA